MRLNEIPADFATNRMRKIIVAFLLLSIDSLYVEMLGEDDLEGGVVEDFVKGGGRNGFAVLVAMTDDVDGAVPWWEIGDLVGGWMEETFEFWRVSDGWKGGRVSVPCIVGERCSE